MIFLILGLIGPSVYMLVGLWEIDYAPQRIQGWCSYAWGVGYPLVIGLLLSVCWGGSYRKWGLGFLALAIAYALIGSRGGRSYEGMRRIRADDTQKREAMTLPQQRRADAHQLVVILLFGVAAIGLTQWLIHTGRW